MNIVRTPRSIEYDFSLSDGTCCSELAQYKSLLRFPENIKKLEQPSLFVKVANENGTANIATMFLRYCPFCGEKFTWRDVV